MLMWKCHLRIWGLPHQNLGAVYFIMPGSPQKIIKFFKKLSSQLAPLHLSHFGDFRRPWLLVTSCEICHVVRDVQKNLDMLLTSKKKRILASIIGDIKLVHQDVTPCFFQRHRNRCFLIVFGTIWAIQRRVIIYHPKPKEKLYFRL